MLTAKEWAQDQQGQSMNQMFPPGGFAMHFPVLVWLAVLELLGLVGFPCVFLVFANLQDRGFVVSKTIGLLMFGYITWIALSLHLATFDLGLLLVAFVALALAAAALAFRLRHELLSFVRVQWRSILAAELVFLGGFGLFILLRMWYPDLGHQFSPVSATNAGDGRMGEKQMELAYLNAIVRSRAFPPYDPFFAGGYINYYYYGFYLVGALCKLTQIAPATGFNLAIATFFALLAGNMFSAVSGLTRRVLPGIAAVVLVGLIGNLNGAWQLIQGLMTVARAQLDFPILGGIVDVLSGMEQVLFGRQVLPPFDFWEPTRIIPPVGLSIAEFPFFTFLFADLHPHLMAYPMTAAALALAVSLAVGSQGSLRRQGVGVLVGGLLVGALIATNPWDFPTYVAVIGLGALVGAYAVQRKVTWSVILRPAVWIAGLVALSAILYLPFERNYRTVFATGIGFVRDMKTQLEGSSGLQSGDIHDILVTPLSIYLEHFGFLLFLIVSYLVLLLLVRAGGAQQMRRSWLWIQFAVYYRDRLRQSRHAARVVRRMVRRKQSVLDWDLVVGLLIVIAGLLVFQDILLAFLVGVGGLAALLLFRLRHSLPAAQLFVLALFLVPVALSITTQLVFLKDWLAGGSTFRMNTIFKFYNQAWVLYGASAAAGLYFFVRDYLASQSCEGSGEEIPRYLGSVQRAPAPMEAQRASALALAPSSGGSSSADAPTAAYARMSAPQAARDKGTGSASAAVDDVSGISSRAAGRLETLSRLPAAWLICLFVLLAASLVYSYAGTIARETYRSSWLTENSVPFTLDGMAFMKVAYPADYAGISWLNAHVHGAKVIAEADDAYYNWRSRVSTFTGLPDIYNGIHEGEQRYGDELDPTSLCNGSPHPVACLRDTHSRQDDVKLLYDSTSAETAWRVIRTYGVRYIYVGFSERQLYSRAGLDKFRRMSGLRVAFRHPGVIIYAVKT